GSYYYLRWTGVTVHGSGVSDAFAIDDIALVANPSTSFVEVSGMAHSIVLNGNAAMVGNMTVIGPITFNGGKLMIKDNSLTIAGSVTNSTIGGLRGSPQSRLIIDTPSDVALNFDQTTIGMTNSLSDFILGESSGN